MWRIEALLCIAFGLCIGYLIMGFPQDAGISKVTHPECSGEIWESNRE